MNGTLLNFLLFGLVAIGILTPVVAVMAIGNVYDGITRKPAPPPHVIAPEEKAESMARVLAMHRRAEAMNEWRKTHPFPKGWAARRANNAEAAAFAKTLD
jgi:hypothetical protein